MIVPSANPPPGRNESCWCGSTIKYKYCHSDIDSAQGALRVDAARKVYVRGWERNAANLEQQGAYNWMAKRLEPYKPKRILDIGSGDGKGVAALWNLFRCELLISLDENPECLEIAKRRLENLGASPNVIRRMDVEMKSEKKYLLKVSTGKLPKSNGTYFIESDVLADPELEEFLERIPLFDAITIWLMGTHLMRQNCLNLAQLQMTSNGEYRLRVQNKIYEMADKILRPGGVLQVVDRGEEPNTEYLRTETIAGHKDQASVTSLEVQDMEYMPYTELESGNHVSMVKTIGKDGPVRDIQRFAVISVIAIKPG